MIKRLIRLRLMAFKACIRLRQHCQETHVSLLLVGIFTVVSLNAFAQLTPSQAGYVDAVADYGAINDGVTITTTQLQNAINGALSQNKGLFLPAGDYLIDGTLTIDIVTPNARDILVAIAGSSVDPNNRSTIILKSGTFTDPNDPKIMLHSIGWRTSAGAGERFTDTYERVIQSVDFKIQSDNAGAIALNWRGAEGVGVYDINIDVTGGYSGMAQAPGSGGSVADVTIIGGEYGVDQSTYLYNQAYTSSGGGVQPTPTYTAMKFIGQTRAAMFVNWNRGTTVVTGSEFVMNPGVPAFRVIKPSFFQFYPGSNVTANDCKIEYTTYDASNVVFEFPDNPWDAGFYFDNVYVKDADKIVDHDAIVNSNNSGWRHFERLAYDPGDKSFGPGTVGTNIYVSNSDYGSNVYNISQDVTTIPGNLLSFHGWGDTFPSFETPGAVSVVDYGANTNAADNAPAFNAAIASAEASGSNVVFVPAGRYRIQGTITLRKHTKLIGVSAMFSAIEGYDTQANPFDGSTDPYSDPRPMVQTVNDPQSDAILADIAVQPVGPYSNIQHSTRPIAMYAILWRAGRNSIIRNVLYEHINTNNNRPNFGIRVKLRQDQNVRLGSTPSPLTTSGVTFTTHSESQYFNWTSVASRMWVETVANSKRIMAPSHSPFNVLTRAIERPNIVIEKGGSSFSLTSLKLANSAFDPLMGRDITVEGFSGGSVVQSTTLPMTGINKPRDVMDMLTLNWSGVDRVEITSDHMFSLDDVVIDGQTVDFEGVSEVSPADNVDYATALYYDRARELPISMHHHHLVKITGGVKWYTHRKHGDSWMRPTQAYVAVINNTEPINLYHFHAQHSQNDQKLYLENASDVTVLGIKTENIGFFIKAVDSDNIRVFGHGGLTSAPSPGSHYLFENTTNYFIASASDELYGGDNCQFCGSGSAMLPRATFGSFDAIADITAGTRTASDPSDRPILWLNGNPTPSYLEACTNFKNLTVDGGSGSGNVCVGNTATVIAPPVECKTFLQWTGDTQYIDNPSSAQTFVTMPDANISITATYSDLPTYELTVNNGSGSGSFCENLIVDIEETGAPNQVFTTWTGDIQHLSNPALGTTSFSMPAEAVTLTANFRTNLAYAQPVTVSSVRTDKPDRIGPTITDGDYTTRWESDGRATEWAVIDLGAVVDMDEVVIHWEGAYPSSYQVQTSNDNNNWTDIFSTTLGDGGIDVVSTTASARYLRILCTAPGTPYNYSIWEVEVFGQQGTPSNYTLNVSGNNGSVTKSPDQADYAPGTLVDLTATPDAGYQFDGWSGDASGSTNPLSVTMDANKTITANFSLIPVSTYTLSVSGTNGSVTKSPDQADYNAGSVVTLTATPDAGYQFDGWSGDASGSTNPLNVTMDANKTITANFSLIPVTTYTLSVSGANGSVSKSPDQADYADGSTVTLTATPDANYQFDGWSGDASGSTNPLSVTMDANKSITANFSLIPSGGNTTTLDVLEDSYVRPASQSSNNFDSNGFLRTRNVGSTSSNTEESYLKFGLSSLSGSITACSLRIYLARVDGSNSTNVLLVNDDSWSETTITAANQPTNLGATLATYDPNAFSLGYIDIPLSTAMVEQERTSDGTLSIKLVTTNSTIIRYHSKSNNSGNVAQLVVTQGSGGTPTTYTVNTNGSNGSIAKSPDQASYSAGSSLALTATPDAGYQFDGWSGDASGTTNPLNVTVNSNLNITANFSLIPVPTYTLNVSGANGSVAKSPDQTDYNAGSVVTLTATPDAGYQFDGWSGDASGSTNPLSVTMDANKSITANFSLIPSGGNTTTLDVLEDSYVRPGSQSSNNFDSNGFLRTRNVGPTSSSTEESYLKFGLSSLSGSITACSLRIYLARVDGSNSTDVLLVNDDSWSETTITAANQPTNLGATLATYDPNAFSLGYIDVPLSAAMVEQERTSDGFLSMKLVTTNSTVIRYHSKSKNSGIAQLVVTSTQPRKASPNSSKAPSMPEIRISPNPNEGIFEVEVEYEESASLMIFNKLGQQIMIHPMQDKIQKVDLKQFAEGIYFVRVIVDGKISSARRVIVW